MKRIRFFPIFLMFIYVASVLMACGSREEDAEVIDISEDAEKQRSWTTFGAKPLPFAEEMGISFTEKRQFTLPYYAYAMSESGELLTAVECPQNEETITIENVGVSEADGDGYVTYTLHIDSMMPYAASLASYEVVEDGFVAGFLGSKLELMDYYTGTIFPSGGLNGSNENGGGEGLGTFCEVEWDGEVYTVGYDMQMTVVATNGRWSQPSREEYLFEEDFYNEFTYIIRAPADYDGLVLYLNKNGRTEYQSAENIKLSESRIFGEDEEKAEDCWFIRLKDLVE